MARQRSGASRGRRLGNGEGTSPGYNAEESPLDWLVRRRDRDGNPLISAVEYDAGERLRRDFTLAQMTPSVTLNWSRILSGGGGGARGIEHQTDMRAGVIAAEARVRQALAAVGPDLSGILIDVCCLLRGLVACEKATGWPQRSGKIVLQIALRQLARHYGLDGRGKRCSGDTASSTAEPRAVRVRHWGAEDFRPSIQSDLDG